MMKKIYSIAILLSLFISGCIVIEDDPLVTVDPTLEFNAHLKKDVVYVTTTIYANPAFINPGNIPTILLYEGELELYDETTGNLLASTTITGKGLTAINEVSTLATNYDKIIIIASGTVSAYADKESDGDSSNDLFIHESDFYEVVHLTQVLNIQDYPVVTVNPSVDFQMHIRSKDLYTTATVRANPSYIVTGAVPIVFNYDGVMQLYDEKSGILLKSSSLSGDGLSNAVTIVADTTSFEGFVIIASGTISVFADIESDGDPSNDLFISAAEFSETVVVDLEEDL